MPPPPPPGFGSPLPGQIAGQVRPYEADENADGPAAKRPKVEKLTGGQFYPVSESAHKYRSSHPDARCYLQEGDWIQLHPQPISLSVQLPDVPDRPEWKLNGSIISIPDIPVGLFVRDLRDRIAKFIDAPLPIARMKIDFGPKRLANPTSLASVNIDEGDVLVMSIAAQKK